MWEIIASYIFTSYCSSKFLVLRILVIIMWLCAVDENTPNNINFATFHQCRLDRLKYCVRLILCWKNSFFVFRQKVCSSFFFPRTFIYRRCRNNIWSLGISKYFHKTNKQLWIENSEMTGLKDCKSCKEYISLSLAERKPHEKNEWKFSNQLAEVMYASLYLPDCRIRFFSG